MEICIICKNQRALKPHKLYLRNTITIVKLKTNFQAKKKKKWFNRKKNPMYFCSSFVLLPPSRKMRKQPMQYFYQQMATPNSQQSIAKRSTDTRRRFLGHVQKTGTSTMALRPPTITFTALPLLPSPSVFPLGEEKNPEPQTRARAVKQLAWVLSETRLLQSQRVRGHVHTSACRSEALSQ